ncbi:MAG: carbon-nitrogen hydrolase family protein [Proteobacteria bacterium]|nr:carbon-nitrogen hydrolase family protein [Cystobacterineae bacterium]MCL2314711.1 carbon-nitrogen hydrolase family protein [Pseudomonadota bacterium]
MTTFKLAALQMTSLADKNANLQTATRLVTQAAQQGALWVGLPENCFWMGPPQQTSNMAETLEGPSVSAMANLAKRLGVGILVGSFLEKHESSEKPYNSSVLLSPQGECLPVYRKIHLFDAETGEHHHESANISPGNSPTCIHTPAGIMGLSICYDVRFPELYRQLSSQGAQLLWVPAAFTWETGCAHWEILLRARAIENLCWLAAPAQTGQHSPNRKTFGHAMVVDPWGKVVARCEEAEGMALATIDLQLLAEIRSRLPALQHRRLK